ncbi:hypothetical protein [Streptomyces sp. NPDC051993]|uniref:hypothetical protein n=1 Tax=Streptomyces sp. NPDC051993 TaxID=3155286 RepID=UPI00342F5454
MSLALTEPMGLARKYGSMWQRRLDSYWQRVVLARPPQSMNSRKTSVSGFFHPLTPM